MILSSASPASTISRPPTARTGSRMSARSMARSLMTQMSSGSPSPRSVRAGAGGEVESAEDRRERDLHLVEGEGRADATPDAAAEGQVLRGGVGALQEARGPERVGLRPGLLAAMGEVDAGGHARALGNVDA